MVRLLTAALLALALAGPAHAEPAPIAVVAVYDAGQVTATWAPVAGAWSTYVFRVEPGGGVAYVGNVRVPGIWQSHDGGFQSRLPLRLGDRVVVIAYDPTGAILARGDAVITGTMTIGLPLMERGE